ncbi:alpha/beta hydrolase [Mesorhizobium amorphae]|uniref:alpha/beta hydrolase n=1 Tax=Mesorhizobium amorphae TaxID=71433 RepID=UPI0021B49031|nr:hypothetical protein [Mesorhizobium amorphae]
MTGLTAEADWPREILDRDYSARASVSAEVFEAEMRNYRSRSEAVKDVASHLDVVYDAESGQTLDIYGAGVKPRPVFVFIHGGYWRMLSKHDSAFMAAMLARHGIATAVIDYSWRQRSIWPRSCARFAPPSASCGTVDPATASIPTASSSEAVPQAAI